MMLAFLMAGCDDDSSPNSYVIDFRSGVPMFELPDNIGWSFVTSRMILMQSEYYNADSGRVFNEEKATAYFYTERSNFCNAGKVTINGYYLDETSANDLVGFTGPMKDIIKIGTAYERKMPVKFGGEEYYFKVGGSEYFQSLEVAVDSPQDSIEMDSPQNGKSYNKNSGLAVIWECDVADTARVRLLIETDDGNFYRFVPNSGYHKFSADDLADISTGEVTVSAMLGNYALEQLESGYYAIAVVGSVHSVRCKLTE
jgi:hypothetical protein